MFDIEVADPAAMVNRTTTCDHQSSIFDLPIERCLGQLTESAPLLVQGRVVLQPTFPIWLPQTGHILHLLDCA